MKPPRRPPQTAMISLRIEFRDHVRLARWEVPLDPDVAKRLMHDTFKLFSTDPKP